MKKLLENKYAQIVLGVIVIILFYFFMLHINDVFTFLGWLFNILKPLIFGLLLAYIMHPIVNMFENKVFKKIKNNNVRRNISITITLLIILTIITLLVGTVIPELLTSIKSIIVNAPSYFETLKEYLKNVLNGTNQNIINYDTIYEYTNNFLNNNILPEINNILNSLGSGIISAISTLFTWLIAFVFSVYVLANTKTLKAGFKRILYSIFDVEKTNDFLKEVDHINTVFINFMIGKVCDSSIILLSTFVFLLIFGFPYPLLIAVIIGLTDLIPYFGPYIGTIPSALLICLTDPIKAAIFIIFIIVLQQIDANLITPRIQSKTTGLPSLWVLVAITLFGGLFGIIGLLIGVPCFTIIYELCDDIIERKLKKKNMPVDLEYYEADNTFEKIKARAKSLLK